MIPEEFPLVDIAVVCVCPDRLAAVLVLPAAVAAPLLTEDVPDNVPACPFLDAYVFLTLEPDEVLCPKYLSGPLSPTKSGPW